MTNDSEQKKASIIGFSVKIIVSILLLILILLWCDVKTILYEFKNVSLRLYSLVVLGHFLLMAIKALRWKILLASFKIHCTYLEALKAYVAAFSFGTFTPGQLGDMAKVMLIDCASGRRKLALIPSFTDRVWDLLGLLIASTVCAVFIFPILLNKSVVIYIIFSMVVLLFATVPTFKIVRKLIFEKKDIDIILLFHASHLAGLLTLVAVVVQFARWAILAVALSVPVLATASSAMIGTLVALIPVSFGGLGTREAAMAWLFGHTGLLPVTGVSFSLLMFGAYLIGALVGVVVLGCFRMNVLAGIKTRENE